MTPHEERLVLEYHSKWGNRWSRIARKLPGRTDNEIKNYWRTHLRKKAQKNKRMSFSSSSYSNSASPSSTCTNDPTVDSMPINETNEQSFYDTEGVEMAPFTSGRNKNNLIEYNYKVTNEKQEGIYSMDEIWKDIDLLENDGLKPVFSPIYDVLPQAWDYSVNSFWTMDGGQQEFSTDLFFPAIN